MGAQFVSKMWWLWRYSWNERSKYKYTPRMYAANEINSIIFNPFFWNIWSAVNSLKPTSKYILFVKFIYSTHLFTRIIISACIHIKRKSDSYVIQRNSWCGCSLSIANHFLPDQFFSLKPTSKYILFWKIYLFISFIYPHNDLCMHSHIERISDSYVIPRNSFSKSLCGPIIFFQINFSAFLKWWC